MLLIVEALAVIGLLELALRVAYDHSPPLRRQLYMSTDRPDWNVARTLPELMALTAHGFIPRRRHLEFILNSRGLKTHEYTEAKPGGTLRVLAIGDSFSFSSSGVPYVGLWHQQLGARLEAELDRPVEVISLGVRAVGPDFYRRMWEIEGKRLDADLVIVGLFVGNDLLDVQTIGSSEGAWIQALARSSYVIRFARNRYLDSTRHPQPRSPSPPAAKRWERNTGGVAIEDYPHNYDPERPSLPEDRFLDLQRRRVRLTMHENAQLLENGLALACEHLEALVTGVRKSGARVAVMLIPSEYDVSPEFEALICSNPEGSFPSYDLDLPFDALTEWCDANVVPCLDMRPRLRAEHPDERIYRALDTHWSRRAHDFAAEELSHFAFESGLVP